MGGRNWRTKNARGGLSSPYYPRSTKRDLTSPSVSKDRDQECCNTNVTRVRNLKDHRTLDSITPTSTDLAAGATHGRVGHADWHNTGSLNHRIRTAGSSQPSRKTGVNNPFKAQSSTNKRSNRRECKACCHNGGDTSHVRLGSAELEWLYPPLAVQSAPLSLLLTTKDYLEESIAPNA